MNRTRKRGKAFSW